MTTAVEKWTVESDDGTAAAGAACNLTLIVGTEDAHIAFCFGDRLDLAKIVAAAPDLLAACKSVLSEIDGPNCNPLHRAINRDKATGLLRAAIAKATGATP